MATNTNKFRDEIRRSLNCGNACYYSVRKLLSSRPFSEMLEDQDTLKLFGTKKDDISEKFKTWI
jgi:hypothetical protein